MPLTLNSLAVIVRVSASQCVCVEFAWSIVVRHAEKDFLFSFFAYLDWAFFSLLKQLSSSSNDNEKKPFEKSVESLSSYAHPTGAASHTQRRLNNSIQLQWSPMTKH